MNVLKTLLSSVALSSLALVASVGAYTDVIPSYAQEAVEELTSQGVLNGDGGTNLFNASRELNRAEVSKVIVLATGVELTSDASSQFPDVQVGAWYYSYVNTMAANGWINGYPDGTFGPSNKINRSELAKMVVNAFGIQKDTTGAPHFSDVPASAWFYEYVETLYNNDVMKGFSDGTFGPAENVTRAETAVVVYEGQQVVASSSVNAEGTLEVSLSNQTPAGTNIPYNATSVPFTTVEFTAADDADIEISSISIDRLGLGDNDDFDKVWLEIDGFKVGNDKSINSDDMAELTFNPAIVVPAGQTLVADIVASMTGDLDDSTPKQPVDLGHISRLAIISAEGVNSSAANIAGDFPIEGEEMEISNYGVSNLEFTPLSTTGTDIEVGDQFIEIGKFNLQNQSTSNKDIELRAITLKNTGSAELIDSLDNAVLYVSGTQISVGNAIIDGDYITFRLDNGVTGGYVITDGLTKIISVRADIVAAEKNDKIQFKIDNYEDVVAIESATAFGVRTVSKRLYDPATDTYSDVTEAEDAEDNYATMGEFTIKSGDLNVSRDPASLGSQEVSQSTTDVVLLTSRVTSDQPVVVDGVRVGAVVTNDGSTPSFDNFKLYVNGSFIDSVELIEGGFLDFDSQFELSGTTIIKVTASVDNSATDGASIIASLSASEFDTPEYVSNGDAIDTAYGSATGSVVKVLSSEVTITKTDSMTAEVTVGGADNIETLKFNIDNNKGGEILVSNIELAVALTDAAATDAGNFQMGLFVDGVQIAGTRNLVSVDANANPATAKVTFGDASITVPSNGYKQVTVVMDTTNSVTNADSVADTLQITSVLVEATNQANGQTANVNGGTTPVAINGAVFTFEGNGKLTIKAVDSSFESGVIRAGATGVEVFKVSLEADNDYVEVSDLYLDNSGSTDFNNLGLFELVAPNGDVVATDTMTGDKLHFSLSNNAVVTETPQVYTVRVNVGSISDEEATAAHLLLSIDQTQEENGAEALTVATGADLATSDVDVTSATKNVEFVAYKSLLSLDHSVSQPSTLDFDGSAEHVYSFVASADGEVELSQISLEVQVDGGVETAITSGSADDDAEVTELQVTAPTGTPVAELTSISFNNNATATGDIVITLAEETITTNVTFGTNNDDVAAAVVTAFGAATNYTAAVNATNPNVVDVTAINAGVQADATVDVDGTGIEAAVLVTTEGSTGLATAGNVTVNLNGSDVVVAVAADATIADIATSIQVTIDALAGYSAVFDGTDLVTVTAATTGVQTDATFADTDTTGAAATVTVTTDGADETTPDSGGTQYEIRRTANSPAEGVATLNGNIVTIVFDADESITNGSSVTYQLWATGINQDIDASTGLEEDTNDGFTVKFVEDTAYAVATTKAAAISASNIVWSDGSDSTDTDDYLNGFELEIDLTTGKSGELYN